MSVYLVRRETKKGVRWHVRAELCDPALGIRKLVKRKDGTTGIETRLVIHLGVFETKELADLRRDTALEEIAQGRPPVRFTLPAPAEPTTTVADAATLWLTTLNDLAEATIVYYTRSANSLPDWLAGMEPDAVSYTDIQKFVAQIGKAPGTVRRELAVLKMILDQHGVRANPVSDKRVRLPRKKPKAHRLPSRADIEILCRYLPTRVALLTLLTHTGLRIHEAASLRWRDIDHTRGRLLVASSKTAAGKRWVDHLPGTPPFPKMPEGGDPDALVFTKPSAKSLTTVLREVHNDHNGVPLYSAHDFRHLHASRLLHDGILSPAQIAARLGHANPSITLSIYSHVVPPD